ncbi:MAG TPA: FAD-dependent oxidoreductase [Candidatus Paceibacterota bacterium]|nr:FAD-dependent oxidoreductase [Candidatus Paceibacterota bacterium]HRY76612.1 FAD-dependent oxidoreductase [Candidatus Paceibacterota bacterium]
MNNEIYELIILGAGPAGTAAGVYASRKKIKTLLITEGFGGQATAASQIENIIGHPLRQGPDLALAFERHLKAVGMEMVIDRISGLKQNNKVFEISTPNNGSFQTQNILIALGSQHKTLGIATEEKFKGRGVNYCSTCDAPLYKDKIVAVVGGGNSGFDAVIDLLPYASKIYLLELLDHLNGDPFIAERIRSNPKVETILNAKTLEVTGETMVEGLAYQDLKTQEKKDLTVQGIFVEIGMKPNVELFKDWVKLSPLGEIVVEPLSGRTSADGIWAAGDITNLPYKQINIAMGDGIRALLDIYGKLRK